MFSQPYMMTLTAPQEAPWEMPSTYGSAREFLVSTCIRMPQRVRPAPTTKDVRMRGVRMVQMISSVLSRQVGS